MHQVPHPGLLAHREAVPGIPEADDAEVLGAREPQHRTQASLAPSVHVAHISRICQVVQIRGFGDAGCLLGILGMLSTGGSGSQWRRAARSLWNGRVLPIHSAGGRTAG